MSYEEFKDAILAELKEYYSHDVNIYYREVLKTNGIKLDGLSIIYNAEDRINPVIYIDDFYDRYTDGEMSFEEVVGKIIDVRNKSSAEPAIIDIISDITDWDKVSEQVYPFLINTESNQELLKDLVSRPFLDLSVIYVIRIPGETLDMWASIKITKGMLERYGVNENTVYERALQNLRDKDSLQVRNIFDVIRSLAHRDITPSVDSTPNMYVLTNGSSNHGASQLLNINQLSEEYPDRSFFVIPSSVHEAILIDYEENVNHETINEMIRDVNATVLDATDILSDHVYLYNGKSRELSMCA